MEVHAGILGDLHNLRFPPMLNDMPTIREDVNVSLESLGYVVTLMGLHTGILAVADGGLTRKEENASEWKVQMDLNRTYKSYDMSFHPSQPNSLESAKEQPQRDDISTTHTDFRNTEDRNSKIDTLPLPRGGREAVSERPSAQVHHIQVKGEGNSVQSSNSEEQKLTTCDNQKICL
ncbi:hypothetical protein H5410_044730 [Solanum commersonii]|uniref:Uncharacterized protein n=1 Tax=Solanum commersonii TaxID=4109 RepID=A0A9J5XBQ4_SOLCO|nr:hypothetical protein H5410_044730 [Solanum commersonii]